MSEDDAGPGIALAVKVFNEFVAPDFGPEGIASFREWANPTAFAERLRGGNLALAAVRDDRIVGMIEWVVPDHVAMLFVDPATQGEGIGRRLFDVALRRIRTAHPDLESVSVHASCHGIPFYRRIGFRETGPETERNGIRYTPMLLTIEE